MEGSPGFHVVNYKEGGFMIVSADNRIQPILASVENGGSFPSEIDSLPIGVQIWAEEILSQISTLKRVNTTQSGESKMLWERLDPGIVRIPPTDPSDPDCEYEGQEHFVTQTTGPIFTSNWNQRYPFNANAPDSACVYDNGKALLGCTTLAVAMVMRYNQKPTSYAWSNMPTMGSTSTTNYGTNMKMLYDIY